MNKLQRKKQRTTRFYSHNWRRKSKHWWPRELRRIAAAEFKAAMGTGAQTGCLITSTRGRPRWR